MFLTFCVYSFHRNCNTMQSGNVVSVMSISKKSDNSYGQIQSTV